MYKLEACLRLSGDKFSPRLVEEATGISFTSKNEVGDIGKIGINRDKPIPYGSASLYPPDDELDSEYYYSGFEWIVNKLEAIVDVSRQYGAEEIYVDLAVYHKNQCNMAFEPEQLAKIAKSNISLWISCYQDDDLDDR